MRHSQVDRRARRTVPVQCVADHGMHRDAPRVRPAPSPRLPKLPRLPEVSRSAPVHLFEMRNQRT